MNTDLTKLPWDPLSISQIGQLLKHFPAEWLIAGGYAIELFVGRSFRRHGDLDIWILRKDQQLLPVFIKQWEFFIANQGQLTPWEPDQYIAFPIQSLWARAKGLNLWQLQIMLVDVEGEDWLYRRDPSIRLPFELVKRMSKEEVPYLAPEIQLLYKSKLPMREKDQIDFDWTSPLLPTTSKAWLSTQLSFLYPQGHPWITQMKDDR